MTPWSLSLGWDTEPSPGSLPRPHSAHWGSLSPCGDGCRLRWPGPGLGAADLLLELSWQSSSVTGEGSRCLTAAQATGHGHWPSGPCGDAGPAGWLPRRALKKPRATAAGPRVHVGTLAQPVGFHDEHSGIHGSRGAPCASAPGPPSPASHPTRSTPVTPAKLRPQFS